MAKKTKQSYTIYEARTQLSKILRQVEQGAEITISRGHKPIARLLPLQPAPEPRQRGSAAGTFILHDDFDAPLPADMLAAFNARPKD